MSRAWIIVADTARARIFSSEKDTGSLNEIETLAHPESRIHEQELTSDLPGRAFDSQGAGRHAMGQDVDPKKHEAIVFAKTVADHLDAARKQGKYHQLVIVAAPAMLGLIRDNMSKDTQKLVIEEINKNLAQHTTEDIRQHLPAKLPAITE